MGIPPIPRPIEPRAKSIAEKLSIAAGYISEAIAHPDVPTWAQESMSYALVRVGAAAKAARGD